MSNDKVRIGVVGVGFGTQVHIPAFQSEGLDVVAVCSRHSETAKDAARRFDIPHAFTNYEEMISMDSIDAISIATPPSSHSDIAMAALEAGKHVLCEKPFAKNQDEAWRMWQKALSSGLTAMICHEFRFASGRMRVKELIDENYIGQLHMVNINLLNGPRDGFKPRPSTYRDNIDEGVGFLGALGSHYIDCLRHWFGEVSNVSGQTFTHFGDRLHKDSDIIQATSEDTFNFRLNFTSGGWASMVGSNVAGHGPGGQIDIYGREGTLVTPHVGIGFNPPPHGKILGAQSGDTGLTEIQIPERLEPFSDDRDDRLMPFRLLTREFVAGIRNGHSPTPNFYDGYKCQQIIDAIRESSITGRTIMIASDV